MTDKNTTTEQQREHELEGLAQFESLQNLQRKPAGQRIVTYYLLLVVFAAIYAIATIPPAPTIGGGLLAGLIAGGITTRLRRLAPTLTKAKATIAQFAHTAAALGIGYVAMNYRFYEFGAVAREEPGLFHIAGLVVLFAIGVLAAGMLLGKGQFAHGAVRREEKERKWEQAR